MNNVAVTWLKGLPCSSSPGAPPPSNGGGFLAALLLLCDPYTLVLVNHPEGEPLTPADLISFSFWNLEMEPIGLS